MTNSQYLKLATNGNLEVLARAYSDENKFISVYAVFFMLKRVKKYLGLESMLTYARDYMGEVEKECPVMKDAIASAVEMIDLRNE
ncbi:MAG: hypothetical protein P9X22_08505 [Candidatus Zapsychrus exili]|nr:hypothetical protein [Candidatus Zapsychrus exili]